MTQARVAIIMRTKNHPLLLARVRHSVLDQSFQNWVHVILNVTDSFEHLNDVLRPVERIKRRFRGNFVWRRLSRLFPR